MALYGETGKWALSNKQTLEGIPLTFGAQSDWTRIAKTEIKIPVPMLGNSRLNFFDALTLLTTGELKLPNGAVKKDFGSGYNKKDREGKINQIKKLQAYFYDAAIPELFKEKDADGNLRFENLKQVYEDVLERKRREKIKQRTARQ